jgi:hypothetical protein
MNTLTIPQLAEQLRHHINTDNDAPRHIVEELGDLLDTLGWDTSERAIERSKEHSDEVLKLEAQLRKYKTAVSQIQRDLDTLEEDA